MFVEEVFELQQAAQRPPRTPIVVAVAETKKMIAPSILKRTPIPPPSSKPVHDGATTMLGAISSSAFRRFVATAAATNSDDLSLADSAPPSFRAAKLAELDQATFILVHRAVVVEQPAAVGRAGDATTTKAAAATTATTAATEQGGEDYYYYGDAPMQLDTCYFVSALPPTRSLLRWYMGTRARTKSEHDAIERVELVPGVYG
jgi:hypothetical protein